VKPDGRAWVQAASSVQVDAAGNTLRGNDCPLRSPRRYRRRSRPPAR
jgi:hypothetical protein